MNATKRGTLLNPLITSIHKHHRQLTKMSQTKQTIAEGKRNHFRQMENVPFTCLFTANT